MTSAESNAGHKRLETLGRLVESSPAVVFLWRIEPEHWPVEAVSAGVQTLLGYTPEDFTSGRVSWPGITHPEDVPRLEREVADFLAQGHDEWTQEYRLIAKGGRTVWILDWNHVIRHAEGKTTHIQGLVFDVTERKRAEDELRTSEARFRMLVERLPDTVTYLAALDARSTTTYISPQIETLLGYWPRDYGEDPDLWAKCIHPDDRERVLAEVAECHCTGKPLDTEYRMIRKDGRTIWFHDVADIVRDADGKPMCLLGINTDITARKQGEEALKIQRDLVVGLSAVRNLPTVLRLCLDAAIRISGMDRGGIYLTDDAGGLRLAQSVGLSDAFVAAASYYPRDAANTRLVMAGGPVYVRHPDLDVPLSEAERQEALRALAMIPIRHEGRIIGCMNVASRTLDEVPARSRVPLETIASGVGLLITRAQADEAVLTQSAIVSTMAEGVCLVRVSDDTIVYANPRFERMFGYGPGEMNGLPVARVNFAARDRSDEQVARDIIARLARTGEAEYEVCNVRKDGTPFWCLAHATTLDHPALGKVWVAVHEDITERKRAEAALEQKNAALRELLEQMAAEKGRIHETIVAKIEDAVLPLLPKLRLRGASRKYLDLLKHHLRDISGTYTGDARRRQPCRLTPRETEIGEMIRARLSSKDIAAMLGLSVQTVQRHRRNIRRRLGLRGKKQNLTSFLAIR